MLGKSINWIPVKFLIAVAIVLSTTEIACSQENPEFITARSIEELNSSSETDKFLKNQNFVPSFVSQVEEIAPETNRGQNLRRRPIEQEQEFTPRRVPIIVPGLEEIQREEELPELPTPYKASPNISIITPSGYGADWGRIGIGIGFQQRTRFTDSSDGGLGIGFGLGDSRKYVGLQIGLSITDISSPFNDGRLNLKIHRRLPYDFSIAAGVQGGITYGETDGGSSVYGVVTKRFPLQDVRQPFSEIYTSVGVGGGQFRSESDINNGINSVGVFGSVAVRVLEPVSVITEWSGQDLTIGISVVPFKNLPFVIVPAITDITGSAGDGARFILGAGYSFSF
jgi:hypothetical protein